ncbi:MAG: metallophosphoesterase [Verrucomicrobiia bacterium]
MNNVHAIQIAHIADLHARRKTVKEFELRAKCFFQDVEQLAIKPDVVFVTGDIAYSGSADDYQQRIQAVSSALPVCRFEAAKLCVPV